MSKYGIFFGPYFPVLGLNTGIYGPEKNYVFGDFSHCTKFSKKLSRAVAFAPKTI